jgi:hypothetical protein
MSTQPQPKTIAEIAKETNAAKPPTTEQAAPKPPTRSNYTAPKPPSTGSRIHAKWATQLEKFIGLDVAVQPRLDMQHVYHGRLLALDLQQFHAILQLADGIILIRQPATITRWTSPRLPAELPELERHAAALPRTSELADESQPTTETSPGGDS